MTSTMEYRKPFSGSRVCSRHSHFFFCIYGRGPRYSGTAGRLISMACAWQRLGFAYGLALFLSELNSGCLIESIDHRLGTVARLDAGKFGGLKPIVGNRCVRHHIRVAEYDSRGHELDNRASRPIGSPFNPRRRVSMATAG